MYADQNLVQTWQKRLSKDHGFKIGIHWNKNEIATDPHENKNIPLNNFVPLIQLPHVSVYSLQPYTTEDLSTLPHDCILKHFGAGFTESDNSLYNLAAIIENLDLIITRDATLVHIAGALGKPVFVLLPKHAEWRWMQQCATSPWYPTMKLFRQNNINDWSSVPRDVVTTITTEYIV
jgi:ADP-heptose:LPS heptosyltransferase